jgi:hypothetical protein
VTGPVVYVARCPIHGLHGERSTCFDCGGPVEQVPMVERRREPAMALASLVALGVAVILFLVSGIAS